MRRIARVDEHHSGLSLTARLADEICALACRSLAHGLAPAAAREEPARLRRPIDYMHDAGLEAELRWLDLSAGMQVVDFPGPHRSQPDPYEQTWTLQWKLAIT